MSNVQALFTTKKKVRKLSVLLHVKFDFSLNNFVLKESCFHTGHTLRDTSDISRTTVESYIGIHITFQEL